MSDKKSQAHGAPARSCANDEETIQFSVVYKNTTIIINVPKNTIVYNLCKPLWIKLTGDSDKWPFICFKKGKNFLNSQDTFEENKVANRDILCLQYFPPMRRHAAGPSLTEKEKLIARGIYEFPSPPPRLPQYFSFDYPDHSDSKKSDDKKSVEGNLHFSFSRFYQLYDSELLRSLSGFQAFLIGNLFFDERLYKLATMAWKYAVVEKKYFPAVLDLSYTMVYKQGNKADGIALLQKYAWPYIKEALHSKIPPSVIQKLILEYLSI